MQCRTGGERDHFAELLFQCVAVVAVNVFLCLVCTRDFIIAAPGSRRRGLCGVWHYPRFQASAGGLGPRPRQIRVGLLCTLLHEECECVPCFFSLFSNKIFCLIVGTRHGVLLTLGPRPVVASDIVQGTCAWARGSCGDARNVPELENGGAGCTVLCMHTVSPMVNFMSWVLYHNFKK